MLNAVENDSDAIILMFRPDNKRGRISDNEITILKNIEERISSRYTKEMLFWVVNRVETGDSGDNVKQVEDVVRQIRQRNYNIASVLNVNCFSKDEVENKLLVPVLKQLSIKIQTVDTLFVERLNKHGEALFQSYTQICQAVGRAFASSANEDLKRRFFKKINQTDKKKLLGGLRDLYLYEYNELRQKLCENLVSEARIKLKNIISSVPSKEKVIELLSYGDVKQDNAYEACTDLMRMPIIDDFTELDNTLGKLVEDMKQKVLHIFADPDKGRLGFIYPLDCRSDLWIDRFLETIEGEKKYPLFTSALRKFRDYTINVQGFLIHEIREQLDLIDISLTKKPEVSAPLSQPECVAEEIIEWLTTYAEKIHDNIQLAMNDLYKVPNRSMFAAVKDLYDRLTYTMYDNENKIEEERRYLYEDWIRVIWKDEFEKEDAMKDIAKKWDTIVSNLKEKNKPECFIIRN